MPLNQSKPIMVTLKESPMFWSLHFLELTNIYQLILLCGGKDDTAGIFQIIFENNSEKAFEVK